MTPNELIHKVDKLFHRERQRKAPENPNDVHEQTLSMQDKIAVWITGALGTMYAVYLFGLFMAAWMFWQTFILHKNAFDPYPYAFLLFLGNIIQLLLMPLIMVGQNIQGRHAEVRTEEAFKATLASYHDAEHIIDHLAALDKELLSHRQMLSTLIARGEAGSETR
jgi:uncharacterized membrane protein